MTTQTLRGMANDGPMHWRGDRTGGQRSGGRADSHGAFDENGAFTCEFRRSRSTACSARRARARPRDMQAFTDFILQVTLPPNPSGRSTARSRRTSRRAGDFYFGAASDGVQTAATAATR